MSVNKKTTWYPQGQEEAPGMMSLCATLGILLLEITS